jgi:glucan-binding YG repeat protein
MEATFMKVLGVISTTALFLLLGATVPAFAQEEHHDQEAQPEKQQEGSKTSKQEEAKPEKQQEQAKTSKQEEAKPAKQEERAKPEKQQEEAKPAKQEEQKQAKGHEQQSQGQYAHDGQKDSHGHVYSASRFGPDHHARFVANGGRLSNGRREYSYGGYWFYAGAYPAWFYQHDVYFILGADGLWYAVAYDDPSLTFQVNIE